MENSPSKLQATLATKLQLQMEFQNYFYKLKSKLKKNLSPKETAHAF